MEPESLSEASSALIDYGHSAVLLAGGTDLLALMKAGALTPKTVINLKRIQGLDRLDAEKGEVRLGALTTIRAIEADPSLRSRLQALPEAAGCLGSIQIRYLATIGGNLCRAAPCSETAPPLIAYDARVRLAGPSGERWLPLEQFFTGPGTTALAPGEVLAEVSIPSPPVRSGAAYLRHGLRALMDLALVNVSAWLALEEDGSTCADVRIVLGSVAPTPIRARAAEDALRGRLLDAVSLAEAGVVAARESRPITDVRASADYRQQMVQLFVQRALHTALTRAKGELPPA
jgi:carbon-monoxide dehydrogenase medium subunit